MQESAKRVDKPWGYEIWWARTDRYVGKILHINAGESTSTVRPDCLAYSEHWVSIWPQVNVPSSP